MKPSITDALLLYYPNTQWVFNGNGLEWLEADIPKPSQEDLELKLQQLIQELPMKLLRKERDSRLAACDWITLKSYSRNETVPAEWSTYMQELRDLPSVSTPLLTDNGDLDITSIEWPQKPL